MLQAKNHLKESAGPCLTSGGYIHACHRRRVVAPTAWRFVRIISLSRKITENCYGTARSRSVMLWMAEMAICCSSGFIVKIICKINSINPEFPSTVFPSLSASPRKGAPVESQNLKYKSMYGARAGITPGLLLNINIGKGKARLYSVVS